MWPDHCVMKSEDAELAEQVGLEIDHDSDIVIQKGFNCEVRLPESIWFHMQMKSFLNYIRGKEA